MRLLHVHLLAGWLVALAVPGQALSDQRQMLGGAVQLEAEAEARDALQQFVAVEARLKALCEELSSPDRERTIEEFRSEAKALRQEAAKLEERIRAAHRRRDRSILDSVQSRSLVLAGTGTGNAVLERLYSGLIAQTDPQRGTSFPPQLFYEANGTDEGVQKLIARRAEAAVLDRPLRGEERDALQRAFPDPGKQPLEKAFASAVLVVVVHARNPIRALTVTETKKIYRGEIDNWADVGSFDRNITRVGTKYPTLSWWMFSDQILGNESIRFPDQPFPEPGEPLLWKDMREWYADRQTRFPGGGPFPRYEDDAKVIEEVSKSPNAIGYCILLPADQKPKGVRIVPIAAHEDEPPIAPTHDRIVLDEYPLHQALWFLVSPDASAAGKALVEFACSEQAIATITQCGLHPLTERPQMLAARRMDQFRMGHGVPVSVSGPDATQLMMQELVRTYVHEKALVQLRYRKDNASEVAPALLEGAEILVSDGRTLNVEEEMPRAVLGSRAVGVVVHPHNPFNELAKDDVRQILGGEIDRWPGLSGTDERIVLYGLPAASPLMQMVDEVLGLQRERAAMTRRPDTGRVILSVAAQPGAMGLVDLTEFPRHETKVKLLAILPPGERQAAAPASDRLPEEYPFAQPVSLYLSGKASDAAKAFFAFVAEGNARESLLAHGLVPRAAARERTPQTEATAIMPADFHDVVLGDFEEETEDEEKDTLKRELQQGEVAEGALPVELPDAEGDGTAAASGGREPSVSVEGADGAPDAPAGPETGADLGGKAGSETGGVRPPLAEGAGAAQSTGEDDGFDAWARANAVPIVLVSLAALSLAIALAAATTRRNRRRNDLLRRYRS